jgi:hypothetical protein
MTSTLSPSGVATRIFSYDNFMGLDAYRDQFALDTGQEQYFTTLNNGFADFRGVLMMDAGATKRAGNSVIDHLNFVGEEVACWAQIDGAGISLSSERGHTVNDAYPLSGTVTSTIFGRKAYFFCQDHPLRVYDGLVWRKSTSQNDPRPGFGVAVQRRLATAGYISDPTAVYFTRADNGDVFPDDEVENATNVLKAHKLDVANQLSTSDSIKGLGVFEKTNLVIFTSDQALIYAIDPDYTKIQIIDKSTINVGTISHRTISEAGADLLFCSRHGVHSLRRSETNGISIYTIPLSHSVELMYRKLYRRTPIKSQISAYYDQDRGQYHIFFPFGPQLCDRMTLTINPVADGVHKWSTGDFLRARCGARLGDQMIWGTPDGVYNIHSIEDRDAAAYPTFTVETPILWNGSLNDTKSSHSIVIQASGKGSILVEGFDEKGRSLSSKLFDIDDDLSDDSYRDVPLNRQYENKFEHRYRGLRLRFTIEGKGLIRIAGFAVLVRK